MNVMVEIRNKESYVQPKWGYTGGDWIVANKKIVILSNSDESPWVTAVTNALVSIGTTQIWDEKKTLASFKNEEIDLLLLDASTVENDVVPLVQLLHLENEWVPIVVATTSPTWRRARKILLAGATDYIGRSLDPETILGKCQDALEQTDAPLALWE